MKLSDFYESEYPEHDRTSCSDERPINAEANGMGCKRCNAIFFEESDRDAARLDWLGRYANTCTLKMDGQHPWSFAQSKFRDLRGPTFRAAIDAAMNPSPLNKETDDDL